MHKGAVPVWGCSFVYSLRYGDGNKTLGWVMALLALLRIALCLLPKTCMYIWAVVMGYRIRQEKDFRAKV